jgi:hypothetical protein
MTHILPTNLFNRILFLPKLRKAMYRKKLSPVTDITEQQLELAMERRSIMTATFQNPELADMEFFGPCLRITDTAIHIDALFYGKHSACFNEAVEVRFCITHENHTSYFRFTSVMRDYNPDSGFVLDIPAELLSGQRRECVRIAPQEEDVPYLEIWPLEPAELPQPQSLAAAWGSGRKCKEEIVLKNISAGGLCLKIAKRPDDPVERFEKGSMLLCFLRLKHVMDGRAPANDEETLTVWLACTVKYCTEPDAFDNVFVGVAHTAWAVPDPYGNAPSWATVGEAGQIPLLFDWVWQQQKGVITRNRR